MIGMEVVCDVKQCRKCQGRGTRDRSALTCNFCESTFPGIICGQARQGQPEGPRPASAAQRNMPPSCRHRESPKVREIVVAQLPVDVDSERRCRPLS
jgi:hypothetical protein